MTQFRGIYILFRRNIYRELRELTYYYQNCIIRSGITILYIRRKISNKIKIIILNGKSDIEIECNFTYNLCMEALFF
jgi:hypothetical protein